MLYANHPPNKKPRELYFSEERTLDRYFQLSLYELLAKLDLKLMALTSKADIINGFLRKVFRFFAEEPDPMARNFGHPSRRVSIYLTEVQTFLRHKELPVYHFHNVNEDKRADYELAKAIEDILVNEFVSTFGFGSPTLAAVIIVKMGLQKFLLVP